MLLGGPGSKRGSTRRAQRRGMEVHIMETMGKDLSRDRKGILQSKEVSTTSKEKGGSREKLGDPDAA